MRIMVELHDVGTPGLRRIIITSDTKVLCDLVASPADLALHTDMVARVVERELSNLLLKSMDKTT